LRISARGYRRDSGSKTIFDEDVVGAVADVDGEYRRRQSNTLYLQRDKRDGSITMDIAPRALSGFGGDYRLYVHLTPDEIIRLFLECFPQVDEVIARLVERSRAENKSAHQLTDA
jgi:hypothetical protein